MTDSSEVEYIRVIEKNALMYEVSQTAKLGYKVANLCLRINCSCQGYASPLATRHRDTLFTDFWSVGQKISGSPT